MQCQGPNCPKEVEQLPGGHRARKYCSNACRVAAHRATEKTSKADRVKDDTRRADATRETRATRERQEIRNRYAVLSEALIDLLLYAKQNYGLHSVSVIGTALVREQAEREQVSLLLDNERQRAALAQLLLTSSKDQQYPELRLSGYLRLFPGYFTENDLPDISEGRAAWQRAVAKLSVPALLITLVSMQARHALEEQRSIASERAWHEHLSLEEARKEASEFSRKYYQLKERVESTSASIAANGDQSADAEKIRVTQELERLRTLIAKQEQALAVRSDTVIKRGATIRAQEKAIQEQKNQLAKVTDELEMAEEKIQRLDNQLERVRHLLEAGQEANQETSGQNKQQAAIERARNEIRALYQVSITVAEENRDKALKQVAELSRQLEQTQRGAEEVSEQEKPLRWMSEPSYIVLQTWRSRPELTEEQLEWIKWQAIKDTSAYYHTEAGEEHYRQALQAYFEYANVPAETAEAHIPPSLKAASVGTPVARESRDLRL